MTRTEARKEDHLLSKWKVVAIPAAWLLATFGFVLAFPIRLSSSSPGPEGVVGVAGIVVAVAIAALDALLRATSDRLSLLARTGLVLICLVAFIASWACFDYLKEGWTCSYTQEVRLVVGAQPTEALRKYIALAPTERASASGVCRMVMEYVGDTLAMYEYSGLANRYYSLVALYLTAWLELAMVVMGTVNILSRAKAAPKQVAPAAKLRKKP